MGSDVLAWVPPTSHQCGDRKNSSVIATPGYLLMRFRQQLGRWSALRSWRILAFVSALTALSTLLSAEQADGRTASANLPRQSHGASALVRVPVVDGNDIRFSRLSTARGLSQTRVRQIVEDNQGFIWFGTQYGLDRFDGYEYKVFVHDPARLAVSLLRVSSSSDFRIDTCEVCSCSPPSGLCATKMAE
jgi:ligand-binding sensor domain-containing protein